MTESDKERAERLGDPKLQAAYRALGAEEPPRALDDAVLAASRRAVQVHPAPLVAPTGRRSWSVPLAAAAVLALAVGVTLHMQMEQPGIESSQPAYKPSAPAARDATPGAAQDAQPARKREEPAAAAPKAITRKEAEAFPSSARDQAVAENRVAEAVPARAPAAPAAAPRMEEAPAPAPAAAAPAMRAMQRERIAGERTAALTPEKELERVAELRKQGLHDEADRALAEFRKRYPDFKIPAPMLERVERR